MRHHPAPEGPQGLAQPPQEEAPDPEAEQEKRAADQLDTQELQEDEAEAPAPPEAQDIGEAVTVERERIVLPEPPRGPTFANAKPERTPW